MSVPVERRWSAAELDRVIRETEELVGLSLGDLIVEYQRGRKAAATPPRHQHRLIELLLQAKDAVNGHPKVRIRGQRKVRTFGHSEPSGGLASKSEALRSP